MIVNLPVVKVALCPCGFRTLDDHVKPGDVYRIDLDRTAEAVMICGGCGARLLLNTVYASPRSRSHGGMIPFGCFEVGA